MLSVVIECKDQESLLIHTLSGLVAGAVDGLISDVAILDGGSQDGTLMVAEAAGCRVFQSWTLGEVMRNIRGSWVLVLEPGAQPQAGWTEEINQYLAVSQQTARFSASSVFRKPFLSRLIRRLPAFENGFLISKKAAAALVCQQGSLAGLAAQKPVHRLRTEIIPAWVLAERL